MKRRGNNGMWLPPSPYDSAGIPNAATQPITAVTQTIIKEVLLPNPPTQGASRNVSIPLVGDFNEDIIAGAGGGALPYAQSSIADMAVGYSLKRVVGKLFIGQSQEALAEQSAPSDFMVTCGIMVRRVNEAGVPTAINTFTDTYDAARDPWLWRRNYLLQNAVQRTAGFLLAPIWPNSNTEGPGVLDGPHVDAKTRRTVKAEERLFLDVTTTALNGAGQDDAGTTYIVFDLRFFGRVFTSAGNRRNATR